MVALSVFRAGLTAFNTAELSDAAMICPDHPADFRVLQPLRTVHLQTAGRPIFNAVVCSGYPEYFDQSVSLKMNCIALSGEINPADRTVSGLKPRPAAVRNSTRKWSLDLLQNRLFFSGG